MKTKVLPRTWKILSREAHLDPPALSPPLLLAYSAPATLAFFLLFWKTLCSLHLKAMAFDGMSFSQRFTGSTLSTPSSTDLLLTVVQSLSRVRLRVTPSLDCSTPGFPVLHHQVLILVYKCHLLIEAALSSLFKGTAFLSSTCHP